MCRNDTAFIIIIYGTAICFSIIARREPRPTIAPTYSNWWCHRTLPRWAPSRICFAPFWEFELRQILEPRHNPYALVVLTGRMESSSSAARAGHDAAEPVLDVPTTNTEGLIFGDLCNKLKDLDSVVNWSTERKLWHIFDQNFAEALKGHSTFPLVRLLIPFHDQSRGGKFQLQESKLIDVYLKALNINTNDEGAKKLSQWKQNNSSEDVCTLLAELVRSRGNPTTEPHTLKFVNDTLDDLARPKINRLGVFQKIINEYNYVEQKWLLRIILARASDKSIISGVKKDSILSHLDSDAKVQYDYCTDLKRTCAIITPTGKRYLQAMNTNDMGIQPMKPFYPMLSRRSNEPTKYQGKSMIEAVDQQTEGPFVMETKIDGERMLFHMRSPSVLLHSRKGIDYTSKYRVLVDTIKRVVETAGVDGCIIDGEVAAWDKVNHRALPFGQNRSVGINELAAKEERYPSRRQDSDEEGDEEVKAAGLGGDFDTKTELEHRKDSTEELRFIVFDCLYLSGKNALTIIRDSIREARSTHSLPDVQLPLAYARIHDFENDRGSAGSLLDLPLAVRRLVLQRLLNSAVASAELESQEIIGMIHSKTVISSVTKERREEISRFFDEKNAAGEEGILIKSLTATYILNNRSGTSWFKLKPDYSQTYFTDMDLLVVGVYYGSGTRLGKFSSFALAVRADEKDTAGDFRYLPCGKVGSGYTIEEMNALNDHFNSLEGHAKMMAWLPGTDQPALSREWLADWKATGDVRPDFLLPPSEKSIVFTVKCTEIVISQDFPVGSVLRFPRIQKIRTDKSPDQVLTFGEWNQKASAPRMSLQHESIADSKRKKESVHGKKEAGSSKIDPLFLDACDYVSSITALKYDDDAYDVCNHSDGDFFNGMTFLVQPDSFSVKGAQKHEECAKFTSRLASATQMQFEEALNVESPYIWPAPHTYTHNKVPVLQENQDFSSQSTPVVMATPPVAVPLPVIYMVDYSAKCVAIFGNTQRIAQQLTRLRAVFNKGLTNPITKEKDSGWILYASMKDQVLKTLGLPIIDTSDMQLPSRSGSMSSAYNDYSNESAEKNPEEPAAPPQLKADSFEGIRTLIQRSGGTLINSYTCDALIVVGPNRSHSISLKNLIKYKNCSVLSHEYVLACARAQQCLPQTADYCLVRSSAAYKEVHDTVDLWGDNRDVSTADASMLRLITNAPTLADRFACQVKAFANNTGQKRKAAEINLGTDDTQKKEKSAISSDWKEVSEHAHKDDGVWRTLAARLAPELQEALREENALSMWNPRIVLFANVSPLQYSASTDTVLRYDSKRDSTTGCDDVDPIGLVSLVAQLRARGACFRSEMTRDVTHIIVAAAQENAVEAALHKLGRRAVKVHAHHAADEPSVTLVQPNVAKRWLENNRYDFVHDL